jgi:hypothetical protein
VRKNHPLRAIRVMADEALDNLTEWLNAPYAGAGRPSVPPEKRLRAQLIQVYPVGSELLLIE